jgi:hypothetical protein
VPPRQTRFLLLLQAGGFALVATLIWADELLDLPHLLLGAPPTPLRLSEAALESGAVAALGLMTILLTLRLLRRVRYLESFVVLCAWCHRVRDAGRWVSLEAFFAARQASTTHGICPDCEVRLDAGLPPPGLPASR